MSSERRVHLDRKIGSGGSLKLVEKLEAIEEIKQLKARYFRFLDTKEWDALRDLFTADAHFDGSGVGMREIADRDALIADVRRSLADGVGFHHSFHHGHNPEIELTSDTTATGIWSMESTSGWEDSSNNVLRTVRTAGYYLERYAKVDGAWKITDWKLVRRLDPIP